ncbi:hypothetical protein GTP91_02290, partial [Rugamonas sp. FT82W]|nr:hypothetical protein [Duganella vulcania]
ARGDRRHPGAVIATLPAVTAGQACTALAGVDALAEAALETPGPLTVGACDFGMLYDQAAFRRLAADPQVDVIVWGVRGNANAIRRPKMFGWIAEEQGRIRRISVKEPLAHPATDAIVLGTFTFRRAADLRRLVDALVARDGRVNGEYYLDSCINDAIAMGLNCRLFEVDHYLSWGTPDDLRTFEYWQSCFHKWAGHPYTLEQDARVPAGAVAELAQRYKAVTPADPGRMA